VHYVNPSFVTLGKTICARLNGLEFLVFADEFYLFLGNKVPDIDEIRVTKPSVYLCCSMLTKEG
jgi:hypothetical protein